MYPIVFCKKILLLLCCALFINGFIAAQTDSCCGASCGLGPNRVVNGSFSDPCLSGYGSDLTAYPCGSGSFSYNAYTEAYDAHSVNPAWTGIEHTGDGKGALLLDGPTTGNPRAWYQTVPVQQGKTYCFTAWFLNVCPTCPAIPSFDIRVKGAIQKTVNLTRSGAWVKVCFLYTALATGPVELAIHMAGNDEVGGNDAMIDDISFREINTDCCCSQITISKTVRFLPPAQCCVTITINAPSTCNIYGVQVGAPYNKWVVSWPAITSFPLTLPELCVPMGGLIKTNISFYDKCGNVICVKPLEVLCDIITHVDEKSATLKSGTATETCSIFPNPAKNQVTLRITTNGKPTTGVAEFIDAAGRVVKQVRVTIPPENNSFTITDLPAGTYIVKYTDASGQQKKTLFIKQKE